ncbi:hypothetical protein RND81_05G043900 [Saponaria officinalis]|uniref:DUF7953 domain-containing protein n=1 Tax=Saponaria officinalis TaxID=3572 RepID=A0AAW1KXQ3_SAPOF
MLCSMNFGLSAFTFFLWILLSSFPGTVTAANVTLDSIHLDTTHEWIGTPTVYFQCKGENKTELPDVKKKNVVYTFQGEESWQPLTDFPSKKCKRCGLYEMDSFPWTHADVFHEWEFCPSDFASADAKYTLVEEKQFNATFSCPACVDLAADPHAASPDRGKTGLSVVVVILISGTVTVIVITGFVGGYRYWQKRKRQQEQLRFMRLFEEHDDIDDELGLGDEL